MFPDLSVVLCSGVVERLHHFSEVHAACSLGFQGLLSLLYILAYLHILN